MAILFKAIERGVALLMAMTVVCPMARALEHVTLRNGFELDCLRREATGDRVRLFFAGTGDVGAANFLEVDLDAVVRVEQVANAPKVASMQLSSLPGALIEPTKAELQEMLTHAGATHHIDVDLLASVVRAESGGHVRAVSRTGARGLMQLMPGTASDLGVHDAFRADDNIAGGTAYLDGLLVRYKDNIALALAAYNAGPGAVDRYHGVPPYRETRAYVARVIREFNRRKQRTLIAATH